MSHRDFARFQSFGFCVTSVHCVTVMVNGYWLMFEIGLLSHWLGMPHVNTGDVTHDNYSIIMNAKWNFDRHGRETSKLCHADVDSNLKGCERRELSSQSSVFIWL